METACSSETLVSFYQTVRRHIPDESNFHNQRSENLKSPEIWELYSK
jgi:hypothetical protein